MQRGFDQDPARSGRTPTDRFLNLRPLPNLQTPFAPIRAALPVITAPPDCHPGDSAAWVLPGNLTDCGSGVRGQDMLFTVPLTA